VEIAIGTEIEVLLNSPIRSASEFRSDLRRSEQKYLSLRALIERGDELFKLYTNAGKGFDISESP
jgi:hypothetical protein